MAVRPDLKDGEGRERERGDFASRGEPASVIKKGGATRFVVGGGGAIERRRRWRCWEVERKTFLSDLKTTLPWLFRADGAQSNQSRRLGCCCCCPSTRSRRRFGRETETLDAQIRELLLTTETLGIKREEESRERERKKK